MRSTSLSLLQAAEEIKLFRCELPRGFLYWHRIIKWTFMQFLSRREYSVYSNLKYHNKVPQYLFVSFF